MKLQPYDITIHYVPGPKVPIADALSRVSPSGKIKIKGLDVTIHETCPGFKTNHVEVIQKATKEDQILQMLMQQLMEGWPQHIKKLPLALRPFWQLRNDLTIEHSYITYKGRLYVPTVLRTNMVKALHQGHPGIVKMKLRAKSAVYWMGLNKEIEEHMFNEPCQIHGRSQQKEPAIPIEIPK